MIILRQKEHSSKLMKVVRTMKRAGNNVVTAIDNAGLKVLAWCSYKSIMK
jgi:hypothetical protein